MAEAAVKKDMFVWEGTDKQGKRVKGEMSGQSDALIKATLRRQGIKPLKVKKKPKPLLGGGGKKKITPKDITVFSRQLATMMSSGVPLVQRTGDGAADPPRSAGDERAFVGEIEHRWDRSSLALRDCRSRP